MTTAYRIVLVDDHVIVRQGLRKIVDAAAGVEVVGEADDGLQLLALLNHVTPDLVVLDIAMPHLRGIEAIHEIKSIQPMLKILILTMHREIELLTAAISAGASGYLLKEDADTELFVAIKKIRQGGTYVSPKLSDHVATDWMQTLRGERSLQPDGEPLTIREREVLKLIAEGYSNKETADLLSISPRTVEHHRAHIMAKLNIRRSADLVKYAISKRYL